MNDTKEWADDALKLLLLRVRETAGQVGGRFPLYADPDDGRWTTTGRGSWTGGFWAGLLWLLARDSGKAADLASASAATAGLAPWAEADTATRGLILWYGTALAPHDDGAAELRAHAAKAALAAWDPALCLVPWGAALGGPRLRARADGVPGLVPLLAEAGTDGKAAAAAHLHRHLDLCMGGTPGGGIADQSGMIGDTLPYQRPRPAWHRDELRGAWEPEADPEPGWTRGEAWLLLAVADALLLADGRGVRTGGGEGWRTERLTACAEQLLRQGEFLEGPLVPPADVSAPEGPLDTSAAAIAAVALLKLARLARGPRATTCSARAEAVLRRLVDAHLTRPGGSRPPGMLLDGCYEAKSGTAVRHELVWGDFFLALGLAGHLGRVDLTRV
ncbi:sugar ABC transporter permease [Streptomyces sp. NPDC059491]|uniref:sugar ABC transporter permease n=1 Tax=Streptomyces sp. NPDC059491 TaxID=3346850 RepID=UPI00368A00E2